MFLEPHINILVENNENGEAGLSTHMHTHKYQPFLSIIRLIIVKLPKFDEFSKIMAGLEMFWEQKFSTGVYAQVVQVGHKFSYLWLKINSPSIPITEMNVLFIICVFYSYDSSKIYTLLPVTKRIIIFVCLCFIAIKFTPSNTAEGFF